MTLYWSECFSLIVSAVLELNISYIASPVERLTITHDAVLDNEVMVSPLKVSVDNSIVGSHTQNGRFIFQLFGYQLSGFVLV